MIGVVSASPADIYEAVLALARSLAGHEDLDSLLSAVAASLRRVVSFEYLVLVLHDVGRNVMKPYVLSASGPVGNAPEIDVTQDEPAGWVWLNQQPLVIGSVCAETRWPAFMNRIRTSGVQALTLVPLTAGRNRLGAVGFGCLTPMDPGPEELSFLQRVADEFAVAVDANLARQQVVRERDRLRVLFDITNALVSKLSQDDLFAAISEQLSRVIQHDFAVILLCNEATGCLDLCALHFTGPRLFELGQNSVRPEGMPSADALSTRKPVVVTRENLSRYESPEMQRFSAAGFQSACSIPLVTANRTLGTLELGRVTDEPWTEQDVELLVQVGRQIAIALDNSLSFRELAEVKDRLATEKLYLEDEIRLDQNIGNMVGEGPAFQSVLKSIQIVAPTDATVLILGETGTGKELVARAIHERSGRSQKNFVKVNCAAIPASLLESELFGHEKGAFTGAVARKVGRFELAHEGTLFLDEIGEMPLELQPKLLRAIQDQEFERVGGTRTIRTNVRFVVATNRDLRAMVEEGKFRSDLYYRLHVFPLYVPPLRERREDIPLLARFFVQKFSHRMNRRIDTIPAAALAILSRYEWPGNIRELQNVIERSVIVTNSSVLTVAMPEFSGKATASALHVRNQESGHSAERDAILWALKESSGIVGGPDGAAARLGMKRTTLQSRMKKYQIMRQYR